jgi:hypothetical protein
MSVLITYLAISYFFRVEPLFLRVSIYNRDGHLQS